MEFDAREAAHDANVAEPTSSARHYRRSVLVLQRDDRTAVAAEGGDSLQIAVRAGKGHDRAVAINRMAGGGKVPAPAFGMFRDLAGRLAQRLLRSPGGNRQTK